MINRHFLVLSLFTTIFISASLNEDIQTATTKLQQTQENVNKITESLKELAAKLKDSSEQATKVEADLRAKLKELQDTVDNTSNTTGETDTTNSSPSDMKGLYALQKAAAQTRQPTPGIDALVNAANSQANSPATTEATQAPRQRTQSAPTLGSGRGDKRRESAPAVSASAYPTT